MKKLFDVLLAFTLNPSPTSVKKDFLFLFVEGWVDRCVDDFADFCAGAATFPVALLVFVVGFFEAHINVHVNDGHDFAGFVGLILIGTVEGPAVVKTDLAKVVGFLDIGEVGIG